MGNFILSPKSYARVKGANDRVNVAVVGFSDRFRSSLLPGFTDHREELNFDMIGVSDIWSLRRDEGVQVVGEKIGHKVKGYRNNEEMYKDKDIDAVIISTPDFAHATHTVEAAEHGKHIYVEKPFAETMEDNRRARAAVEKAGVVFQVGSQRRSAPNYHAANDYIRSGQFGDIVMCEMTWNVNQPGRWREALNTDSMHYHGSNQGNGGVVESDAIASHGREHSLSLTLPPLATIWLVREAQ